MASTSPRGGATTGVAEDERTFRQERSPKITTVQNHLLHQGQVERSGLMVQTSNQNRHNRSDRRQPIGRKTCGKHVVDAPTSLLNWRQEEQNA